jgi:hypothetical protein
MINESRREETQIQPISQAHVFEGRTRIDEATVLPSANHHIRHPVEVSPDKKKYAIHAHHSREE